MAAKKNIADTDLAEMIKERENKASVVTRLEVDLSEAKADLAAINLSIAKELGLGVAPIAPVSASASDGDGRRLKKVYMERLEVEVKDIVIKGTKDGGVARKDVLLRVSDGLKSDANVDITPSTITNVANKLKSAGMVKTIGERANAKYVAV